MKFRKFVAFVVGFSFLMSSAGFAVPDLSNSDYKSLLSSPQGQELLKKAKAGEDVGGAKESLDTGVGVTPQMVEQEQRTTLERKFSEKAALENLTNVRLFGYSAFSETVGSFVPDLESPVPSDYIIGPGDSFNVTLWGISEGIFKVTVNQEGQITLPKVGVVSVAGLRYGDLKAYIEEQLGRYYEQINVNVTIAEIKTIRVYIVGDVVRPGSYTISSLSTLFSALFQAGGPSRDGTMRKINLIRDGKTIASVDLYKFLLYGDKTQDRELFSGDTIFVPPRGDVVAITGNVKRPAIYEIKGTADLSDLLTLSGGFTPFSYLNRIQIERIVAHQRKIVLDKNVSSYKERSNIMLQDMDLVKVYPIYADVQNVVYLEGNFKYTGPYEWFPGMKIKDVVSSSNILKPYSYLPKGELSRINKDTLKTEIYEIDLEKLFAFDELENMTLLPGDRISVFSELKPQSRVILSGQIKLPGTYTIMNGERLSSVIKRAGGFTDDAFLFGAVLTRGSARSSQDMGSGRFIAMLEKKILEQEAKLATEAFLSEERISQRQEALQKNRQIFNRLQSSILVKGRVIITLQPLAEFEGSIDDLTLEDGDRLVVPPAPNIVSILGEVYSPNSVLYRDGEKLFYYINRVGGLTDMAYKDGIYLVRADGSVISGSRGWSSILYPGDIVFVPQVIERYDLWGAVKDWTHWFYEVALAFAVIATYLNN